MDQFEFILNRYYLKQKKKNFNNIVLNDLFFNLTQTS
jgi:hypothetical protein